MKPNDHVVILPQKVKPNDHVVILPQKVKPNNHVVILPQKVKPNNCGWCNGASLSVCMKAHEAVHITLFVFHT